MFASRTQLALALLGGTGIALLTTYGLQRSDPLGVVTAAGVLCLVALTFLKNR